MSLRTPWFVQELAAHDPELGWRVEQQLRWATAPGSLDAKTKLLLVLAIDAVKGSRRGVQVVAEQARRAGAAEAEIQECLRLAYAIAGLDCLAAVACAFSSNREGDGDESV